MAILEEAEDNYYITAGYILKLANKAYDLFKSFEIEERRQLINLVLQNLRLNGKNIVFETNKPFDTLLDCNDRQLWLGTADILLHRRLDLDYSLGELQTVFSRFNIPVPVFTSA